MKLLHARHTANAANANPKQPVGEMSLGERMRELRRGQAEGDDEGEVEQQLQRRRDAMRLVGIAPAHGADVVVEAFGGGGLGHGAAASPAMKSSVGLVHSFRGK